MGKLFDLDSPIMRVLNKVADLMWLNVLTIICCIPIFTIGASLTAAHYVALKMYRNEEGYISRDFFKSFKINFKQSTAIWLIVVFVIGIMACDFYIMNNNPELEFHGVLRIIILAVAILVLFTLTWVFAMQARFSNKITVTIKNSFALSVLKIPRTLLMIVMYAAPILLYVVSLQAFPIILLFGLSVPIYVSVMLYNKIFQKLEDQILEKSKENQDNLEEDNQEKIFSDKLINGDR